MGEMLKSIIGPLQEHAAIKSVYGDPISAQGKTIIPVARIAYGFGGGSGKGMRQDSGGEGEGGGGGAVAIPLGVFEITDSQTRFILVDEHRKILAAGLIGLAFGLFWAMRLKRRAGA